MKTRQTPFLEDAWCFFSSPKSIYFYFPKTNWSNANILYHLYNRRQKFLTQGAFIFLTKTMKWISYESYLEYIWTDSSGTKLFWINSICSKIGLILPTHKLINHFDMQEILIRTWIEVFKLRLVYILAQIGP